MNTTPAPSSRSVSMCNACGQTITRAPGAAEWSHAVYDPLDGCAPAPISMARAAELFDLDLDLIEWEVHP